MADNVVNVLRACRLIMDLEQASIWIDETL